MDRIEMVQEYVDDILQSTVDEIERKCGYKHLYGVSQACAILAMKRNENVELAMIAGLLHDIYTYKMLDSTDHAHKGSLIAKEILCSIGSFSSHEIDKISQAIYNHSDKTNIDTLFDEILKDADVLQHCLYNPLAHVAEHEKDRFRMLKEELGLI
ncbi:MAG: HD domain-containing protein [Lachnospiraceae bacterium]|nr:HD domain-containing protein [Lachnospiraceae bacterium]